MWSKIGMTTPPSNDLSELLKFAQDYQHNPNLHVALEPYKDVIFLLRAKYATYDTITEALSQRGMKVSETTVRKFCRIHQAEIKRLQAETNRKRREAISAQTNSTTQANPPTSDTSKAAPVSDSKKPGPNIARDDF
jgi:hypothetical protein